MEQTKRGAIPYSAKYTYPTINKSIMNRPIDVDVSASCPLLISTAGDGTDITAITSPLSGRMLGPQQTELQLDFSVANDGVEETVEYFAICLDSEHAGDDCAATRIVITDTDRKNCRTK